MIRTATSLRVAWPLSLTTVPLSVPAVVPAFSELSAETETPEAASAGVAPRPSNANVTSDAPAARTFSTSMSDPFHAGTVAQDPMARNQIKEKMRDD